MKELVLVSMLLAVAAAQSGNAGFNYFPCYEISLATQMPNTLDSLVALLEKYERQSSYTNMDEEAEMIVNRYRTDGIVYRPGSVPNTDYVLGEVDKESEKQRLLETIIRPTYSVPLGTYDGREECGLHMMLSHSVDTYPTDISDDVWDGTINRNNRGDRNKRSVWGSSSSSSSYSSSKTSSSSSSSSSSRVRRDIDPQATRQLDNFEPAVHPIEMGVIETPYGPVAAGTLLAGLMSMDSSRTATVSTALGSDADQLPSTMKAKSISGLHAATLAGDLAQVALMAYKSATLNEVYVGPSGRYYDCTTCARFFSLESNKYSLLSRAELFAGLDALLIQYAYKQNSGSYSSNMELSQLLRLYYSEKGLPNMPQFKACNRLKLYSVLDENEIYEQALNFMYAYQNDFPTIKSMVEMNEDFTVIETQFKSFLDKPFAALKSFINSYNYDDEGYNQCYINSLTGGRFGNIAQSSVPPSENMVNLVAVYASQGSTDNARDQRQMIADVARRLGVSYTRSRLGVMSARDGSWLFQLTNLTNIGDWACNFTSDKTYTTGSAGVDSFEKVLASLATFYEKAYDFARSDLDTSSGRSDVVVWQVPSSMPGDAKANRYYLQQFRNKYPDVRIIFVGQNKSPYESFLQFDDDFIPTSGQTLPDVSTATLGEVLSSPRFFVYPACDPNQNDNTNNYNEESHTYYGAVTPNFTTYIRIPPHNFHYSEEFTVRVSGNVRSCFSRTNRLALETVEELTMENFLFIQPGDEGDGVFCVGGPNDDEDDTATFQWPCDRNLTECNPVYISVTGLDTGYSSSSCISSGNDDTICEFPHQIKYTVNHKGMICGASATAPALVLLVLTLAQHFFR